METTIFLCFVVLWISAAQAACYPEKMYEDKYCKSSKHVTGSLTEATNTLEKCNAIVVNECLFTNFFNWRESNNACHCVETSTCNPNAQTSNAGINIYQPPDASTCTSDCPLDYYQKGSETEDNDWGGTGLVQHFGVETIEDCKALCQDDREDLTGTVDGDCVAFGYIPERKLCELDPNANPNVSYGNDEFIQIFCVPMECPADFHQVTNATNAFIYESSTVQDIDECGAQCTLPECEAFMYDSYTNTCGLSSTRSTSDLVYTLNKYFCVFSLYTCTEDRQGKSNADIKTFKNGVDRESCGDYCMDNDKCIAYDYTSITRNDACRLYGTDGPRDGGGVHDRTYCVENIVTDNCVYEFECDNCEECDYTDIDSSDSDGLGGGGHDFEDCLESCDRRNNCNYVAFSDNGYCHQFKTCDGDLSAKNTKSWKRYKKKSWAPFHHENTFYETECINCAECDWDGVDSTNRYTMGGGEHTDEECAASCNIRDDCNYFALSDTGYCHQFKTCSFSDTSYCHQYKTCKYSQKDSAINTWRRYKKTSSLDCAYVWDCDDCQECDWEDDDKENRFSLGKEYTVEECAASCDTRPNCNYFALSASNLCHQFKTCDGRNSGKTWSRYTKSCAGLAIEASVANVEEQFEITAADKSFVEQYQVQIIFGLILFFGVSVAGYYRKRQMEIQIDLNNFRKLVDYEEAEL